MKNTNYEVISLRIHKPSEAPKGPNIFYKCKLCGGVIPSQPNDNIGCECGNIFIDIDYFRLDVEDFGKFEAVRAIE